MCLCLCLLDCIFFPFCLHSSISFKFLLVCWVVFCLWPFCICCSFQTGTFYLWVYLSHKHYSKHSQTFTKWKNIFYSSASSPRALRKYLDKKIDFDKGDCMRRLSSVTKHAAPDIKGSHWSKLNTILLNMLQCLFLVILEDARWWAVHYRLLLMTKIYININIYASSQRSLSVKGAF